MEPSLLIFFAFVFLVPVLAILSVDSSDGCNTRREWVS